MKLKNYLWTNCWSKKNILQYYSEWEIQDISLKLLWSATQECKMCFLSIPTLIPHRRKKRNACSLLNTSYNVVTKQYIFILWINAFPAFLAKTEVTDSSEMKTKQKSQRNSQIHSVFPWCMNKFCYRVIHPLILCWRSLRLSPVLKGSEGNWSMYSLLKLTLVQ